MATVKLKDVLKSLPQDTSLTGSEMVVINDNGENKYIPYSTIKSGLVNAQERSTLANTAEWLIAHDNVTTIDELNKELDAFNAETAQGLHRVKCWGIPLFVTFSNLNVGDTVLMQTIQGSITFNSAKTSIASINTVGNLAIAVRFYQGGKWGAWSTPMSDTAIKKAEDATAKALTAQTQADIATENAKTATQKADAATAIANASAAKSDKAASDALSAKIYITDMLKRLIPTGLEVSCIKRITVSNPQPVYIKAVLTPTDAVQNIIFISDNRACFVTQDGRIRVLSEGVSTIQVVPTCNTALTKTIAIEVGKPFARLNTMKSLRLSSDRAFRLT